MTKKTKAGHLDSWSACNHFLREATERGALILLKKEQAGKRRIQYLLRIHARYNKMRGQRERTILLRSSK